jgi:histidine ammonia-lyase
MAAQGIELRAPLETSPRLRLFVEAVRAVVPALHEDRPLSPDIEAAARLVRDGTLAALLTARERASLLGEQP